MTTDHCDQAIFNRLLECLMPDNGRVLWLMEKTGMRITDALNLRRTEFFGTANNGGLRGFLTYTEKKTGKKRNIYITPEMREKFAEVPDRGSAWLFPGRDPSKHRTRQAVWKDLKRCAKLWRVNGKRLQRNLGTHTARKVYAVDLYDQMVIAGVREPLKAVQDDLNHNDLAVTYLYAMADLISQRRHGEKPG